LNPSEIVFVWHARRNPKKFRVRRVIISGPEEQFAHRDFANFVEGLYGLRRL
jgi:hypothetical protein